MYKEVSPTKEENKEKELLERIANEISYEFEKSILMGASPVVEVKTYWDEDLCKKPVNQKSRKRPTA